MGTNGQIFIMFISIFIADVGFIGGATRAAVNQPTVPDFDRPLSFEPNRGQTDASVEYLAHGAGYNLFLSDAQAVVVLHNSAVVRMRPAGASASSLPEALDEQASKSNYFIGNVPERWHTEIPNYAKVRYYDVYPDIDLIYYGNERQIEYDFVIKPGVDPGTIRLQFDGPVEAVLDSFGDLVIHTAAGDLHWHKPVAYQEVSGHRIPVTCAYAWDQAHDVTFSIGSYDRSKSLIIDPVLEYSTYLGGSDQDQANAIAVDSHGNAIITGTTDSLDFPTESAYQDVYPGYYFNSTNAFVSKFDTSGKLVYSTYLGGSGTVVCCYKPLGDLGNGIAVDTAGNVYVTGSTVSADFPTKNPFQKSLKGSQNAFVTKFNAAGSTLVYSTYLGGSSTNGDSGASVAVDKNGNAYVTGGTTSTDFPTKNAFQKQMKNPSESAFVTKFSPAGKLLSSTYLGGSGGENGTGIAVDSSGEAYVTGGTESVDFPTKNAFQNSLNGGTNAFVTKFDAAGTALVYSTYLGGSYLDTGLGIAVDKNENAYVTGSAGSTDFPLKNPFQSKPSGAFVTKFDATGDALIYSTYLGGSYGAVATSIAVDAELNAYVTGYTSSADFPIKNAFQSKIDGSQNAFVTKFDAAGTALVYSSYLGGKASDLGSGVAVDRNGNAYIAGGTTSIDFPIKNAFQSTYAGNGDAFVTKISAK